MATRKHKDCTQPFLNNILPNVDIFISFIPRTINALRKCIHYEQGIYMHLEYDHHHPRSPAPNDTDIPIKGNKPKTSLINAPGTLF